MEILSLRPVAPLTDAVLVVALDGWVNAGEAGTRAAEVLAADGEVIATADPDALFDYRANRPLVDFSEGVLSSVEWPHLSVRLRPDAGRPLVVVTGSEPNWNWRKLGRELAEMAVRLGVAHHVSIGGIPWATPHTRPVTVIQTASAPDLLDPGLEHPEGLLRVPASAVTTLELDIADAGIPTVGFWARVPHYVGVTYHAASLALVERVAAYLGVEASTESLAMAAAEQRTQLDAVTQARPEVQEMVSQLELLVDQQGVVSGEQLAAEIERFLREAGGEGRSGSA
jgi:hypothetical protein